MRRAFQVSGVAGLVEKRLGPQAPHPNRVEPAVEEKILAYSLDPPTHGQQRVANELRFQGMNVSPTGVRNVLSLPRMSSVTVQAAIRSYR
ncbi:MAG TPA: helix-turn-helix domain-containing protein [Myxococcota bacterium]|nr:helix-turn-helix domain-containing protein [Myxococcota bacterium]